jgi:hypothetical protein
MQLMKIISISAFVATGLIPAPAEAAYYAWSKFNTNASSESVCLSFAHDVARKKGLQNIRANNIAVDGFKKVPGAGGAQIDVSVILTCVGNMGLVIAISENGDAANAVWKDVSNALAGITCFEGC